MKTVLYRARGPHALLVTETGEGVRIARTYRGRITAAVFVEDVELPELQEALAGIHIATDPCPACLAEELGFHTEAYS